LDIIISDILDKGTKYMICKHFGTCGSCGLYDIDYSEQLIAKRDRVASLLSPFYNKDIEVFDSPQSHYRARAEFRIWHDGDICSYAMGSITKNGAINITECPKVIKSIESRMWILLERINQSKDILKKRLFGVEFLSTTTDETLITLLYHRKLDDIWSSEAKPLEAELNCKIIGRSRKQKVILSDDFVTQKLYIDGREFIYRQHDGGFTQPNPVVNIKMIEWAITQAKRVGYGDFLESYCGLGNFTIPLSRYFTKVLATEVSKRSIQSAIENCTLNDITNISFIRLSSEEMSEALNKSREFNRLKNIDLDSYNFSTVLVDPPRAGLDIDSIELISTIENIIYISCNPESLARDLQILTKTHRVLDTAIYDQFPHTSHIEAGVFLSRV